MDQSVTAETTSNDAIKSKMHFIGKVLKIKLAGALIDLGNSKTAVLHISQLVEPTGQPIKRVDDVLKEGQEVEVWVKKVAKKDGEERVELTMIKPLDLDWKDIKVGMTVKGNVVRLEKFGAFVEIGAERPGLIHVSEMAYGYVKQPSDVVNENDEVEAQVIDVNRKKKQIKLSLKALQPEPVKEEPAPRPAAEPKKDKPAPKKKKAPRKGNDEYTGDYQLLEGLGSSEPTEAEPTAMEIAMREAMEKAKTRKKIQEEKRKTKSGASEQEAILTRTLESKVETK